MQSLGNSRLISVGAYLPSEEVKPQHLVAEIKPERFDAEADVIEQGLGINAVRYSDSAQKPSDLAVAASERALAEADINMDHIDVIIFCGMEGDYVEPSTAHSIQHRLGLKGFCFDVSNACLGFTTGLELANQFIASGTARYALVCTGERTSVLAKSVARYLKRCDDKREFDRKLGLMSVGDAGGAAVVGPSEGRGFVAFDSESRGSHSKLCYYKMLGENFEGEMLMGHVSGRVINLHKHVYKRISSKLGWHSDTISCAVTHQVGRKPFESLSDLFQVPENKMTRTYPTLGNITTATIPVNISKGLETGAIRAGDRVFIAAAGSGIAVTQTGLVM